MSPIAHTTLSIRRRTEALAATICMLLLAACSHTGPTAPAEDRLSPAAIEAIQPCPREDALDRRRTRLDILNLKVDAFGKTGTGDESSRCLRPNIGLER